MKTNYLQQIFSFFRNLALNSMGAERNLYELIQDGDISTAISMMQDRDNEVDIAIKEYNPQTHDVMKRPNKYRKKGGDYITEKLPRTRQRYINEVELFFMFGNPIKWKKHAGPDDAYSLFTDFIRTTRFDANIRKAKRLAGAETESAILFHIYRDKDESPIIKPVIIARSTGYKLRPLFDQYGNMTAFAYGYKLKEAGKTVEHWDIQTSDMMFFCKRGTIGWDIESYPNPTHKINLVYFQQPKAWDGAERRLNREEMLDSKVGDTNNYFADPIAAATADVINSMIDPNKPGKLIQLSGKDSHFEYVNPPQSSETREAEKKDLNDSILFDTFTPDFSFEKMKGLGTLTGAAIKNSMILGYIKRDNRKDIYGDLIDRMKNVMISILIFLHPDKKAEFEKLDISFEFSEPFATDKQQAWQSIGQLYKDGVASLDTAVQMLALTDAPDEEVGRIKEYAKPIDNNRSN